MALVSAPPPPLPPLAPRPPCASAGALDHEKPLGAPMTSCQVPLSSRRERTRNAPPLRKIGIPLALWGATAAAQTADPPAPTAAPAVIVQCLLNGTDDRGAKAQLEAALVRVHTRRADRGVRKAKIEIYLSPRDGETMVAVVLDLKNPRNERPWEPREAQVKIPRRDSSRATCGPETVCDRSETTWSEAGLPARSAAP